MNIKEKIEKLLRLGQSPNENEAKAAMLKARELMMQHKLSEKDFENKIDEEIVHLKTGIFHTARAYAWVINLAHVIATNYGCNCYVEQKYRAQKSEVVICGFQEDAELCTYVFKYAYDCVNTNIKEIRKVLKGIDSYTIKSYCFSYAYGFVDGLQEAYRHQTEENEQEWGLVVVVSPEVRAITKDMEKIKKNINISLSKNCYNSGYDDGNNFTINNKLEENYAN